MKNMLKNLLSFLLIFCWSAIYATNQNLSPPSTSVAAPKNQITYDFCPPVDKLTKTDLFWHAPKGWVSYGESFDNHVTKFVRAEWIGINVGKIICVYKGNKKYAFPIALEQKHNQVVPAPTNYLWSKDLGGRKECITNNVNDCPFIFEKPTEQGNIYENLDFFKGKSHEDDF